jgi:hypothetical protein
MLIFCQASKSRLIFIIKRFLVLNGLKTESRFLRMDQGSEFWRLHQLHGIAASDEYAMEPTGSEAAFDNGKVERPNDTFSVMVRCLLCCVGLSEIFWSAAFVHAVYLKNCLYHKALHHTPHEAWTGEIHNWTTFVLLVPS